MKQSCGSSYQGGRGHNNEAAQAALDDEVKPTGSNVSELPKASVALERYLNDAEDPIDMRLNLGSTAVSEASRIHDNITKDEFVPNHLKLEVDDQRSHVEKHKVDGLPLVQSSAKVLDLVSCISIASSVVQLVQFASTLSRVLYKYCQDAADASSSHKSISDEVIRLQGILEEVGEVISNNCLPKSKLEAFETMSVECHTVLYQYR